MTQYVTKKDDGQKFVSTYDANKMFETKVGKSSCYDVF